MKYLKEQRGLTLLETILALGLVLILVAGFTRAMTTGLQSEIEVEQRLKASNLASGIIELLGEGDTLKNLISEEEDDPEDYQLDLTLYIDDNDDTLITANGTVVGDLDENLLFPGIRRGTANSENEISSIQLEKREDNDKLYHRLYHVEANIIWDERGNKWTHKLISLLAVD